MTLCIHEKFIISVRFIIIAIIFIIIITEFATSIPQLSSPHSFHIRILALTSANTPSLMTPLGREGGKGSGREGRREGEEYLVPQMSLGQKGS